MRISVLTERAEGEYRVAATPETVRKFAALGATVAVEEGAGISASIPDSAYLEAGAEMGQLAQVVKDADIVLGVRAPDVMTLQGAKSGASVAALFDPFMQKGLVESYAKAGFEALSMEFMPRITRAQSMDVLSSQSNLAGYKAVIAAADTYGRAFPMMMTAAGTVQAARAFIMGVGVAGLQAIATAKRLGAQVSATDVRSATKEQIQSLGAKPIFVESVAGIEGEGSGGYASEMSEEYQKAQAELVSGHIAKQDIVITTALIPNREAPELWTEDMVKAMKPGSVIVDLAAEKGGNCKLTVADEKIVTDNGVTIIGYTDFPSRMAAQASTLYSTNIRHMMTDLTPEKDGKVAHNMEDDVIRGATVAYQGEITFPPPPPKVAAIAAQPKKEPPKELTPEEKRAQEVAAFKAQTKQQVTLLTVGAVLLLGVGLVAPASFMQHFIVFVLAVFVGFQVIWGVAHSLHTPLMAVTNAISSIIILGALMQIGSGSGLVVVLAAISVFMAGINIFGGFLVTRRMLAMFQKS